MFWIVRTARLTRQAKEVCKRIAAGDFEARILLIPENDSMAELLRLINDMIDGCDAFVREATAAMEAVRHNKFFRRILPGGLHGALLQGANTINNATASIETRIRQFERQTSELEGSVGSIVSALDNGAAEMSGTAGNLQHRRIVHARTHNLDCLGIRTGGLQHAVGRVGDDETCLQCKRGGRRHSSVPRKSPDAPSSA